MKLIDYLLFLASVPLLLVTSQLSCPTSDVDGETFFVPLDSDCYKIPLGVTGGDFSRHTGNTNCQSSFVADTVFSTYSSVSGNTFQFTGSISGFFGVKENSANTHMTVEVVSFDTTSFEIYLVFQDCDTVAPSITLMPSLAPSLDPSIAPSSKPSQEPSFDPSQEPSLDPSLIPSLMPSSAPSTTPSLDPSEVPSDTPSTVPSQEPSLDPSLIPSLMPSSAPSTTPSLDPSEVPSDTPSTVPSQVPSLDPSAVPSENPTNRPTASIKPSPTPSVSPTKYVKQPTVAPSPQPSQAGPDPTASPLEFSACVDSALRIKFMKDGKRITRSCKWVGERDKSNRCALTGVSAACPLTCGTCDSCVDPEYGPDGLRMRFQKNGSFIARSCEWVARKDINNRCDLSSNICRATCGVCESPTVR